MAYDPNDFITAHKVVVGGEGHNGPELYFVKVICNQSQYDEGLHYEAAKEWVQENFDADGPFWACDENDPANLVHELFNWTTASCTKVKVEV